jgi:hypothetical protein
MRPGFGQKKALRDDAMQGRVREGGDHLAAKSNYSKWHTKVISKKSLVAVLPYLKGY